MTHRSTPETPAVQFVSTPEGDVLRVKRMRIEKQEQERQFAEALVSIIGNDKKVRMARALLDTEYLKSLILKHFTEENWRAELPLHK